MSMTDEQLDAIESRLATVPPSPWQAYCYEGPAHPPPKGWHTYSVCRDVDKEDHVCVTTALAKNEERAELVAEFVAHSRGDIAALVAEVRRLRSRERLSALSAALRYYAPKCLLCERTACRASEHGVVYCDDHTVRPDDRMFDVEHADALRSLDTAKDGAV